MSVGFRSRAAVIAGLSLFCSLGFGAWTQLTLGVPADLNGVHFPTGTLVGYVVGSGMDSLGGISGLIAKTTDGGATWQKQSIPIIGVLNSVYFTDDNTGYAVGAAGAALKTTDGGATWTPMTVSGTDVLNYVRFPGNGQTGYVGVYPRTQAARVCKTADGGANWAAANVGVGMSWSISCGMANESVGVALGKQGMVYGTTDGFGTFTFDGPQTNGDMVAAAFSPTDPNTSYLIGNDTIQGVIRYTSTGGPIWDSVTCPVITSFFGVDMPTSNLAYVCGINGEILVSAEPKSFWRTTVGVTAPIHGLCFPNGEDTGYAVGGTSTILRTYDKGMPWIPGVEEGRAPAITRAGIRVLSNPCRHGIALLSDADVNVVVFDAAGRAVMRQAATKGTSFLRLSAGAYFVRAGAQTARAVVTD
jgi:photosystem II stability/assembly factor-like uncharacterized protein